MSNINNPLVSVIITTYNREKIVSKTIDSVLKQSYSNKQIIVVDDYSTDQTEELLKKYKDKIIYIKLEKNMGVQYASNKGFDNSNGEFLAFVGDDDIWTDRKKLDKQIKIFLNDKKFQVGVITTSVRIIKKSGTFDKVIKKPKNLLESLLSGNDSVYGSAALIRKKSFIEAGLFDLKLNKGTDSDVFRRIVLKGYDIVFLDDITIDYSELEEIRMSNFNVNNINLNIESHLYKLSKYKEKFDLMPNAKSMLLGYIADNYLILGKNFEISNSLNLSLSFYYKSFKVNLFRIRIFCKILLVISLIMLKKLKNVR